MTLDGLLKEIGELDREATNAPWVVKPDSEPIGYNWLIGNSNIDGKDYRVAITTKDVHASELNYDSDAKHDAAFIARARTLLPLCARLLKLALTHTPECLVDGSNDLMEKCTCHVADLHAAALAAIGEE